MKFIPLYLLFIVFFKMAGWAAYGTEKFRSVSRILHKVFD